MLKKIIKIILPEKIWAQLKRIKFNLNIRKFKKMSNYQIFKTIYQQKLWSPENQKKKIEFYSGTGSHNEEFTEEYITRVKQFLNTFPNKPNVIDLGCGDFVIGSQLRSVCGKYIAIDIFDDLINYNKVKYSDLQVDFKTLDITKDELPDADICFLRTVLQHLSNESIKKFLNLIKDKYKYLIITEHLPNEKNFTPNIDIDTGPYIRLDKNSGVELTKKPFNLDIVSEKILCDIKSTENYKFNGVMSTKILQLKK